MQNLARILKVAPLTGSVDRNQRLTLKRIFPFTSLPSRGAWIEMLMQERTNSILAVAPLTGSVDRNVISTGRQKIAGMSLPSRGAWIEIRKILSLFLMPSCRSPHGERG